VEVMHGRPNISCDIVFHLPLRLLTHIQLIIRFVGGRNQFDFPMKVVASRDFTQIITFVMDCYGFDEKEAEQIKLMYKKREVRPTDTILELGLESGDRINLIQPEVIRFVSLVNFMYCTQTQTRRWLSFWPSHFILPSHRICA